MTPTNAVNLLESVKFGKDSGDNVVEKEARKFWGDVVSFLQPLMVIIINFTIIPLLINISVTFEDHETKSSMENVRIGRIYFFMLLNIVLIPITSTSTAVELFTQVTKKGLNWGDIVA